VRLLYAGDSLCRPAPAVPARPHHDEIARSLAGDFSRYLPLIRRVVRWPRGVVSIATARKFAASQLLGATTEATVPGLEACFESSKIDTREYLSRLLDALTGRNDTIAYL